MARQKRQTRKEKESMNDVNYAKNSGKAHTKSYGDTYGINNIKLSKAQWTAQMVIADNTLSFIEGPAGTGKSLGCLHLFVKEYLKDTTKHIVIIKTPVESSGKDRIGFLPDSLENKLEPHFAATKRTLIDLLNKGKVESDVGHRIHFMCPNFILGSTLDNSLILVDEAQQLEPMIMKLLLERIGKGSKMVVMGDPHQLYTKDKDRNGLTDAVERFTVMHDSERLGRYDSVGYFQFDTDDVIRSDIVKTVIRAYR